jgi:hypothetical protein
VSDGTPRLTACVITRDEERRLPACLASLGFCDEVVVVDSGSADRTVALAEAAGARVLTNPWPGFAAQRNVALAAASGEWVLEVDADERIEPALAAAIRRFLADPELTATHDMAMLAMRHRFLGRELGAAMQAPGYRPRLFRRDAYRHDEGRTVHEGLWPGGPALPIDDGVMLHELAGSWQEAWTDLRAYAALEAEQFGGAVTPAAVAKGVLPRPVAKAAYRLLVDGGWRDGWQGAARIAGESAADALTWVRLARGGMRPGAPEAHFGSGAVRRGAVKVVAVATSTRAAAPAGRLLAAHAAAGAEAVLVAPAGVRAPDGVRLRAVARPGGLAWARALDAEHQARPVDGLLLAGPGVRGRVRLARAAGVPRVDPRTAPDVAVRELQARRGDAGS